MRFTIALTGLLAGVAPAASTAQAPLPPAPAAPVDAAQPAPAPQPSTAPRQTARDRPQQRSNRGSGGDAANAPDEAESDVVVTGSRQLPGAVIGDIPPEQSLSPADIRSYGVSSVADLLNELAPQTRSDRGSGGAPVVLLNGRRISGFQEIRDLPTEAIARVDILPEEVALKYGYRADQRVVNFVLRRRFRAFTGELADREATAGGTNTPQAEADLLRINRDQRLNIHLSYTSTSALTESERNVLQTPTPFSIAGNVLPGPGVMDGQIDPALSLIAGRPLTIAGVPAGAATAAPGLSAFANTPQTVTSQAPYRTLIPSSRTFSINSVLARPLTARATYTLNGRLDVTDSTSQNGLPFAGLLLPAGDPFSPFSRDVTLTRALSQFTPLEQANNALTTHLGGTINGDAGRWRYTLTSTYDRVHSETFTDNGLDPGPAQARLNARDPGFNPYGPLPPGLLVPLPTTRAISTSNLGGVDALINGPIATIKAGDINTSVRVGGQISRYESDAFRFGVTQSGNVKRDLVNGQVNLDVPITSRAGNVLPFLGNLSVNGNVAIDRLSDFGTLKTIGYGANWSPVKPLRFIASVTDQDEAPTAQQLGDPQIVTPNARVFDFVRGQTVLVNRISGGNPALQQDKRHTFKLGLTAKPWDKTDLTFTANYIATHTDNAISSFPGVTAQFQAAFPGRFTRDASGNLTQFDTRPTNFARTERSELRYGFNYSRPLKSKLQKQIEAFRAGTGPNPFAGLTPPRGFGFPGAPGGQRGAGGQGGGQAGQRGPDGALTPPTGGADGAPSPAGSGGPPGGGSGGGGRGFGGGGFGGGGPGGGGPGGGGRFGGRGQGGGRLQFALYHTWHFTDRVTVAPGMPAIDLLNGGSLGLNGGQPRHELEGQAGYTNNGLGARLSANYASGTTVLGGTAASPNTLQFGSLTTISLRLFADPTQRLDLIRKHPWLRGTRLTFAVTNLFDQRQRVTDGTGAVPISYQPDLIDPLGRTVRISIRKLFFGT